MLGLLADLALKQTPEAATIQLAAITLGILGCLRWLHWIYEHKYERKCCGGPPKDCTCGQYQSCKLWWDHHTPDCPHRSGPD